MPVNLEDISLNTLSEIQVESRQIYFIRYILWDFFRIFNRYRRRPRSTNKVTSQKVHLQIAGKLVRYFPRDCHVWLQKSPTDFFNLWWLPPCPIIISYIITKSMRALWLVNQLWFIVPVNPRKNRASYIKAINHKFSMGFRLINHLGCW